MSKKVKYLSITDCEKLEKTGDAKKFLISYSLADDRIGSLNKEDHRAVVNLDRNPSLKIEESNLERVIISYTLTRIENSIKNNSSIPSELRIVREEKAVLENMVNNEYSMGTWIKIEIGNKFGFL